MGHCSQLPCLLETGALLTQEDGKRFLPALRGSATTHSCNGLSTAIYLLDYFPTCHQHLGLLLQFSLLFPLFSLSVFPLLPFLPAHPLPSSLLPFFPSEAPPVSLPQGFLFIQISGHSLIKILIVVNISKLQDNFYVYVNFICLWCI